MNKSYSELMKLKTYQERFDYLKLGGKVGQDTFGFERHLNQTFYKTPEWKSVRNEVIVRDMACDLGIKDKDEYTDTYLHQINSKIYVHHINPITPDDIYNRRPKLLDPNNLICTSKQTHDGIHYGVKNTVRTMPTERSRNDTIPWKE